jgi:hypothetical protein
MSSSQNSDPYGSDSATGSSERYSSDLCSLDCPPEMDFLSQDLQGLDDSDTLFDWSYDDMKLAKETFTRITGEMEASKDEHFRRRYTVTYAEIANIKRDHMGLEDMLGSRSRRYECTVVLRVWPF